MRLSHNAQEGQIGSNAAIMCKLLQQYSVFKNPVINTGKTRVAMQDQCLSKNQLDY